MKIKCISNYRLDDSNIGILQIFYNDSLTVKYAILRKYMGINPETHKPMFSYVKVEVTDQLQSSLNSEISKLDQNNLVQAKPKVNIEQNSKISKLNQESSNIYVGRSSSLVRTLALRAKGRRFKSGSAHHFNLFSPVT